MFLAKWSFGGVGVEHKNLCGTMKCSIFSHTVANGPQFTSLTSHGPICSIDTILNRAGSFWPIEDEDPETGLVVSMVRLISGARELI